MRLPVWIGCLVLMGLVVGGCKTVKEPDAVAPVEPAEREDTPNVQPDEAPDATPKNVEPLRDEAIPTPAQVELMKDRKPYVFVAKPKEVEGSETFLARAIRPRTAQPAMPGRATFTDRAGVKLEIVSIVRGPAYEKGATWQRHLGDPPRDRFPDVTEPSEVSIDVTLIMGVGQQAATTPEQQQPFANLDAALARPYVVMLGQPMYVDHGNHPSPAPAAWVDLVGDPKLPNKGFDTFEEALAYAKTLAAM